MVFSRASAGVDLADPAFPGGLEKSAEMVYHIIRSQIVKAFQELILKKTA